MSENPLVSVIVPVYDGEQFLAECLDSVVAQSYRPLETIVIDDGSADGSAKIARGFTGLRLLSQQNLGVASARNHGVRVSRGELIAFIDQDDRWTPDKLSLQVAWLEENPTCGFVLGKQQLFKEGDGPIPDWVRQEWLREEQDGYLPGTLLVRREILDSVGPFDESYSTSSDSDWFFRARDAGVEMHILTEVMLERRIHSGNESRRTAKTQAELLRLARDSILRKRRGSGA